MAFPTTLEELIAAGYGFKNHGTCRGCGADLEWWRSPRGRSMPMNPMHAGGDQAVAHWATCPQAESFRNRNKAGIPPGQGAS